MNTNMNIGAKGIEFLSKTQIFLILISIMQADNGTFNLHL